MKRLLQFLDNNILKIGVIFTSLFIVLYPKLPSIQITHTWVYVRFEDFFITALVLIWFIQLLRRKVKLPIQLGIPIALYWVVGLASLVYCILFIGPSLANFFPKVAALEYFRRVEYLILFFVGFSTIKSIKDLKDYVRFLFIGVTAIVLYGLGQHFYPYFWKYLPGFIQKTNFCFPSFQTGNEEFAKGIPLCLPVGSRVTSTFGGHYDLAGYLLIVLPIILGTWFVVKKKITKIGLGILFVTGLITLILTASRIAFGAYFFAIIPTLILLKKKKWILPIILLSFVCLVLFSESTINRFAQTFRITSVVVNMQGQVVGTAENGLSSDLQKQLANGKAIQANQVIQGVVPEGSSFITLPQKRIATSTAVVKQNLSTKDAQRLKLANGGLELSTVKGNFSVQQALVYDISVTTRLQGEWPNAIQAFLQYPLLGKGYSTLTLAVDNDYLRLLGESGLLGFITFAGIFVILGIYLKQVLPQIEDPLTRVFVYGLVGGVIGLIVNASLFDIFEASKVAEPLWLMLGIGAGAASLSIRKKIQYAKPLLRIATTNLFIYTYLLALTIGAFWSSISNFFIGDDFVWLKWAATSTFADVPKYFTDASGFFYRPVDKLLMLLFYSVFSFQPQGYHTVILVLYFLMAVGVYMLVHMLLKRKLWAFFGAVLFVLLPMHAENIFWIASLSIDLSSVCILFATILYIKSSARFSWKTVVAYSGSVLLAALALFSYELSLVIPVLFFVADFFVTKKASLKRSLLYLPFILLDILYFALRIAAHAFGTGGDYSYSIPHLIPNIFGNIFGYAGLFVFGEWSLPFYTALRTDTKAFALPVGLILVILLAVAYLMLRKKDWKKVLREFSLPLFAAAFMLTALLPYVGLGNIAERYGYLASVGFILFAMWLFEVAFEKISLKPTGKYILSGIIGLVFVVLCVLGLQKAQHDWATASKITYNTLGYFKIEYPTFPAQSTIFIINRPIRYGNAWVFPVGFPEGLWFVYGDQTPSVADAISVADAMQLSEGVSHTYMFSFDTAYHIKRVR